MIDPHFQRVQSTQTDSSATYQNGIRCVKCITGPGDTRSSTPGLILPSFRVFEKKSVVETHLGRGCFTPSPGDILCRPRKVFYTTSPLMERSLLFALIQRLPDNSNLMLNAHTRMDNAALLRDEK